MEEIPLERGLRQDNFSDDYIETLFQVWYRAGRPVARKLLDSAPPDLEGRKPRLATLKLWIDKKDWDIRADELDAEVMDKVNKNAIKDKIRMLENHAKVGARLVAKGMEFLDDSEHGITKAADAIRAIIQGAELERSSRGLPIALGEISRLSDEQLMKLVSDMQKQMDSARGVSELNTDVVDAEVQELRELEGREDADE